MKDALSKLIHRIGGPRPSPRHKWVWTRAETKWDGERYVTVDGEGYWYEGPWALAHTNANFVQQNWRFRNDNGSLLTATWIKDEDTAVVAGDNIYPGTTFRIRFNLGDDAAADSNNSGTPTLQYNLGGAGWNNVPTTAGADGIAFGTSATLTDGANETTQQLSSIAGSTYDSAWMEYDDNGSQTSRTYSDDYTEFEYCLELSSGTEDNVYEFRLLDPTGAVPDDPPAADASLTVGDPNITKTPGIVDPGLDLGVTGSEPTIIHNRVAFPKTVPLNIWKSIGLKLDGQPLSIDVSAGGDQTRTPTTRAVVIDEKTPVTVVANVREPAIDELVLGEQTPVTIVNHVTKPLLGTLTIGEQTPTAPIANLREPAIDELVLGVAGSEPTVSVGITREPGIDELALGVAGSEPTVIHDRVAAPDKDDLVIAEQTPLRAVNRVTSPDKDDLVLGVAGSEPTVSVAEIATPGIDELTLGVVGSEPTVVHDRVASPDKDTLTLGVVGSEPTISVTVIREPGTDELVLGVAGNEPTTVVNHVVLPTTYALDIDEQTPIRLVGGTVTPGIDELTLGVTGSEPTLKIDHAPEIDTGTLVIDEQTPTIPGVISPETKALTLGVNSPVAVVNHVALPTTAALEITEQTLIRVVSRVALPTLETLTLAGSAPIAVIANVREPATDDLVITGQDADRDVTVGNPIPDTAALQLTGATPTLEFGGSPTIEVSQGSIALTGYGFAKIDVAEPGTPIINPNATTAVPSNYEQCDFTGFRQLPGSLKMTWNKNAVRRKSYESRHPQDKVRNLPEKRKGSRRPEQPDRFIEDIVDPEDL